MLIKITEEDIIHLRGIQITLRCSPKLLLTTAEDATLQSIINSYDKINNILLGSSDGNYKGVNYEMYVENTERGHWILQNKSGKCIDHDQYRNDLADRHNLTLKHSRIHYD